MSGFSCKPKAKSNDVLTLMEKESRDFHVDALSASLNQVTNKVDGHDREIISLKAGVESLHSKMEHQQKDIDANKHELDSQQKETVAQFAHLNQQQGEVHEAFLGKIQSSDERSLRQFQSLHLQSVLQANSLRQTQAQVNQQFTDQRIVNLFQRDFNLEILESARLTNQNLRLRGNLV